MKKTLIITGVIVLAFLLIISYYRYYTKSFSPESDVDYKKDGIHIHIKYSRPYKHGRVIFGGLEPYNKIWRTGANEATVFQTDTDLNFKGKMLKAGIYTLWTIPGENNWKIIFNSEYGQWGINFNQSPNKEAKNDVLTVEVPAVMQNNVVEQFTIEVKQVAEEFEMTLQWDKTLVPVPFTK